MSAFLARATRSALCIAALLGASAHNARAEKVLRVVPQSDIVLLDPVFGTAGISMTAGLMIYDTLFTWDTQLRPRPQMVDTWSTSPDQLVWRFTLRPSLRFHDGQPVTSTDVIASLRRWAQFDGGGGKLAAVIADLVAIDANSFEIRLKQPFPSMLSVLAAAPARFLAIMRAQDLTDAHKQITTAIGSGPFRYVPAGRVSGSMVTWERNPDYVPRADPPDGMAGGHVVKVDRIEWHIIPDPATAVAALQSGEVDFVESPLLDLLPVLRRDKQIRLQNLTPLGSQPMLRANNLQPPFNDVRARQALNYVIDQGDELAAAFGDPSNWQRCNSFFVCGGPFGTDAGAEGFHQDFAKARQLLAEAGYKGEKLTFIASHDNTNGTLSEVAADAMQKAGMNIDMVWSDWPTLVGRALNQGPVSAGGWNLRITSNTGPVTANPQLNVGTDTSCTRHNFSGWPCDAEAERLRALFIDAKPEDQPALARQLHERLAEVAPYRVVGQFISPVAYRANITGVLNSPVLVYWNIDKD